MPISRSIIIFCCPLAMAMDMLLTFIIPSPLQFIIGLADAGAAARRESAAAVIKNFVMGTSCRSNASTALAVRDTNVLTFGSSGD
jgi:hypothetical protein